MTPKLIVKQQTTSLNSKILAAVGSLGSWVQYTDDDRLIWQLLPQRFYASAVFSKQYCHKFWRKSPIFFLSFCNCHGTWILQGGANSGSTGYNKVSTSVWQLQEAEFFGKLCLYGRTVLERQIKHLDSSQPQLLTFWPLQMEYLLEKLPWRNCSEDTVLNPRAVTWNTLNFDLIQRNTMSMIISHYATST